MTTINLFAHAWGEFHPSKEVHGRTAHRVATQADVVSLNQSWNADALKSAVRNIKVQHPDLDTIVSSESSRNGVTVQHEIRTEQGVLAWSEFILSDVWHKHFESRSSKKVKLDSAWDNGN